jgi:hypothetical protein
MITLKKKPELDLDGTRWVHFKLEKGSKHLKQVAVEEGADLSLLVGSTASPLFTSHHALIQRHMDRIDRQAQVGTKAFDPLALGSVVFDSIDDMLIRLVCSQLIQDWKGVQEEAEPGVPAEYTAARGEVLLNEYPELYWIALRTGTDVANRAEAQVKETAGKS